MLKNFLEIRKELHTQLEDMLFYREDYFKFINILQMFEARLELSRR